MKTIILAALMVGSAATAHEAATNKTLEAGHVYRDCLVEKTVQLGKDNAEPADTVFVASQAACQAERGGIVAAAYGEFGFQRAGAIIRITQNAMEEQAQPTATLALMKARQGG